MPGSLMRLCVPLGLHYNGVSHLHTSLPNTFLINRELALPRKIRQARSTNSLPPLLTDIPRLVLRHGQQRHVTPELCV